MEDEEDETARVVDVSTATKLNTARNQSKRNVASSRVDYNF